MKPEKNLAKQKLSFLVETWVVFLNISFIKIHILFSIQKLITFSKNIAVSWAAKVIFSKKTPGEHFFTFPIFPVLEDLHQSMLFSDVYRRCFSVMFIVQMWPRILPTFHKCIYCLELMKIVKNHSIRVGRGLWILSSPIPCQELGHLEQVTQEHVQVGLEFSREGDPQPPWAARSSALPPSM